MSKIIVVSLFISFLLTPIFFVNALSPVSRPICLVQGKIMNIDFAEAEDHSSYVYDEEGNIIIQAPGPQYPDRFVLDILIDNVVFVAWNGVDDLTTCESLYPIGEESKIYIPKESVTDENNLKTSNLISGEVHKPFAYAYFREFSIDIEPPERSPLVPPIIPPSVEPEPEPELPITVDALETDEIYEKLLQEKYVDSINDISLQQDQQTYNVRGGKKGKLLFFIPVTLKIQLEVDIDTGMIRQIKKPWWSFLVR